MENQTKEILDGIEEGEELSSEDAVILFDDKTRSAIERIYHLADLERKKSVGEKVSYIINANVNFTNICYTDCKYCGFWRKPNDKDAYTHNDDILSEKFERSRDFGVTEICMQGGLNPDISLDRYEEVLRLAKKIIPKVHLHAYSPAEIDHVQRKTRLPLENILKRLKEAGLSSIPGTAAEILVERVKKKISPGRISVQRWCEIIQTAHTVGIPTTSTIMYGHIEETKDLVEHMKILRDIQSQNMNDKSKTGFTEFVPLPFIPYDNKMGKEFKITEMASMDYVYKLHSIARLYFKNHIKNIQVSWPKIGLDAAKHSLNLGVNDLGGTLIEENISRESGSEYGQSLTPQEFNEAILSAGKIPVQRTTNYELIEQNDPDFRHPKENDYLVLGKGAQSGSKNSNPLTTLN
ncbi:MAG: 7,8-didemethyl-8-hydroxy-5-deazariboflavin synthase subunit CofH [Nitrospinota bacterium]|nr:7,8-didemethyl-8-hydroxy-5-deazariboflavin synthase subunit CofH [Nitrospinota bacterium]